MGKPAARISDMHVCPMVMPGVPPIPHVGGPITGPGCPTVLIGGLPAAVMGDMCTCVGPPDTIVLGSVGVMIGGKPAARMGDMCGHGGTIVVGCPTVLIGEVSPSVIMAVAASAVEPIIIEAVKNIINELPGPAHAVAKQIMEMTTAAKFGLPLAHDAISCPVCSKIQ